MDTSLRECVDIQAAANGWTEAEEVTSLRCSQHAIAGLYGIGALRNLRSLSLSGTALHDLQSFVGVALPSLTQLTVQNTPQLHTLAGLADASFPALTTLLITDNLQLQDLQGLAGASFPALTQLFLRDNPQLRDLSGLNRAMLTTLSSLRLENDVLIPCVDLQALERLLGPGVLTPPQQCADCPVGTGDITGDNQQTFTAVVEIFRQFLGVSIQPFFGCQQMRADVTHDGKLTPADAACVFQHLLRRPSCLD